MVSHDVVLESLANVIQTAPEIDTRLQNELTLSIVRFDESGEHSNIKIPAVEVRADRDVPINPTNTDRVGVVEDDAGREVGYIYESLFNLQVTVGVYTSQVDPYDARDISHQIDRAFRPYDDYHGIRVLTDPSDGRDLTAVRNFLRESSEPNHDMSMSPSLRRWEQSLRITYHDMIVTEEETIENVDTSTETVSVDSTNPSVELTVDDLNG